MVSLFFVLEFLAFRSQIIYFCVFEFKIRNYEIFFTIIVFIGERINRF
jgi:hypothetical protein